jgi:hypothetical protein
MWTAESRAYVGDFGAGQALSDEQYALPCCLIGGCYRAIIVACGSGSGAGGAVGDAPASSIRSTG